MRSYDTLWNLYKAVWISLYNYNGQVWTEIILCCLSVYTPCEKYDVSLSLSVGKLVFGVLENTFSLIHEYDSYLSTYVKKRFIRNLQAISQKGLVCYQCEIASAGAVMTRHATWPSCSATAATQSSARMRSCVRLCWPNQRILNLKSHT